jgi:iron complex outermembrane receptor protein
MKVTILKLLGLGLLAASLFFPQPAFSEEGNEDCPDCPKKEEKVKLDDVFVHAFGGGAVTYTPSSVIVDVDKYVKAGSVERIEDILMNIAGIDVMKNSGTPDPQAVILMRGFDDSRYIVAMDGRPITGSSGKTNTSIDWSSITLADVEKIEIIRGGGSAEYEAAEGGIINLVMKKGAKRDALIPRVTYTQDYSKVLDYSDPDAHSERVTADGGVGGLTYFLNYGHKSSDGYLKNNQFRGYDYSTRFTYLFPFEGLLTFAYKESYFDREEPMINWPGVIGYDSDYPKVPEDADTIRTTWTNVSYDNPGMEAKKEVTNQNWDLSYEQPIGDTTLKLYGYKSKTEEDNWYVARTGTAPNYVYSQYYDGTKLTPAVTENDVDGRGYIQRHLGCGTNWTLNPWKDNSLTVGYNFKRTEAEDMTKIYRIHAGYFDDLWIIDPKWTLKTGLRVTQVHHMTYPLIFPSERPPGWSSMTPAQQDSYKYRLKLNPWFVLPKFSLTYNIRPETNLFVSVSNDYDIPGC